MIAAFKAGLAYFAVAFAAGFVMGVVRVMLVAPRLGAQLAVLIEAPLMLAISWAACAACIRTFRLPRSVGAGAVMGATAFLLLMVAEMALAVFAFGRPPAAYMRDLATAAGLEGLATQIVFGLFPLVQSRRKA